MGLVVFGVMALYLAISVAVVIWAVNHAKKQGKTPWHWGAGAALLMYLIPFWDWLPTVAAHKYYCSTEAGFWVYKTVDQWKAENSRVIDSNLSSAALDMQVSNGMAIQAYTLNKNFIWHRQISNVFLNVRRYEDTIDDTNSKSVFARRVYFESGKCSGAPKSISDLKFWLNLCECKDTQTPFVNAQGISWTNIYKQFNELGGK